MKILLICLFIATLLPYLSKLVLSYFMQQANGYDNHYPRQQQSALQGMGARALAAHQNSFEALLIFAIAILVAIATNHVTKLNEYLAMIFIISRVIYHIIYLLNLGTLRTLIWLVGLVSCLVIFWSSIPI